MFKEEVIFISLFPLKIVRFTGERDHVDIDTRKLLGIKSAVMIHTHPTDGGWSMEDRQVIDKLRKTMKVFPVLVENVERYV